MSQKIHVLIAGGGLSGLCLANGLLKAGHTCEVFERDDDSARRGGYALNINADGGEALRVCLPEDLFELYLDTSQKTPARRGTIVWDNQLHELSFGPHLGPPNEGPRPHTIVNRHTLRQILRARLDGVLHEGASVTGFSESADGVTVTLSDGRSASGDLLVGADGIRSVVRGQRLPEVQVIEAGIHGIGVYGRSPLTDEIMADWPEALTQNTSFAADRQGHRLLMAPMRPRRDVASAVADRAPDVQLDPFDDYVMVSASVAPDTPVPRARDWTPDTPRELRDAMLRALEGWHPLLTGIVERIELDSMFKVSFGRLDPAPPWEPSRVTLIGDAAHAMLPSLGMGANLSLRDARGLVEELRDVGADREDLLAAVGRAEAAMREAAYPIMAMTLEHDERFGGGGLKELSGAASA